MTQQEYANYIRLKTRTNSTTFTDANIMLVSNIFIDEFAKDILKVNEDYFGMPQTTDLVVNQREYPLPADLLNQIKFVEAKLDGVNWITLSELDLLNYRGTTGEDAIVGAFSNSQGSAKYDLFRGSLWLYSGAIIDVTGGLKLWAFSWPAHLTSLGGTTDMSIDPTTTTHGFPRAFHKLLATRVIIEWKELADRPIPLTGSEMTFAGDYQNAINSIRNPNLSRVIVARTPSSAQTGDNGFNY
jgi:hypothetical protein